MKYIHGGTLRKKVPGGAIVRIIFGFIILFVSLIALINETSNLEAMFICFCVFVWPGAVLFLAFGFRAVNEASKDYPRHNIQQMNWMDLNDPFFTTQCEQCGLVFDYQRTDLGFRAWYRDGFVECPRCQQPIRHRASENVFKIEEVNPYNLHNQ